MPKIFFTGLDREYSVTYWNLPNHEEPFEPLHTDIVVPDSLLLNRAGDRVPMKAQSKDGSTKFCLRFILNAEEVARNRKSSTWHTYVRLLKDARFHSEYLFKAEGVFVPLHYGMWLMDTKDWAGKVLCSITQWCGKSWNELLRTDMNTEANRILVGRTMELLHDYGVIHGGVVYPPDFRHLILDMDAPGLSPADRLNGKAPCYIVDFADARARHACAPRLPVLPLDAYVNAGEVGCAELAKVTYRLGFMATSSRLSPDCESYKALEWYDEYFKQFPDLRASDVRNAQRAKLFKDMPPLYPELIVSFDGPEPYSKMSMRVDLDWDEETFLSVDSADGSRADSMSPETVADPSTSPWTSYGSQSQKTLPSI
ncbi:hypothetical protein DFH07DRAFT_969747 [Mycena maculata]|uniref:Protein kinase domain-containing protein n=1 Tax=Mycena maculata TaxID=230809 RepID=A0AAD7HUU3_9AGAR|nr:hypothetical protein DFH07DRAFT_969747 [Mycena maculata]